MPLSRSSSLRPTWRWPILGLMARRAHDPEVREEALRTLYRLRAQFRERSDLPPHALEAIESLIEEYEKSAPQGEEIGASHVSL
jgi:hypothetical protein